MDRKTFDQPQPPDPPISIAGATGEMLGALDSGTALYQGTLRYWFMWRMPQLINLIRGAQGVKFHLCCSTYEDLLQNYIRLFLLPDLMVVGHCRPLLSYEVLQYEHGIDRRWPNVDGTQPSLGVISGKPDRPILDGLVHFIDEWIRPLSSTGRVLVAPWTTLLAGPSPQIPSFDAILMVLSDALQDSTVDGLRTSSVPVDKWQRMLAEATEAQRAHGVPMTESSPAWGDLSKNAIRYGRLAAPDAHISIPDTKWSPSDILAFEYFMASYLETMFVIAGDWCDLVPAPSFSLNLSIPYVKGLKPGILASAINADPEAFDAFRNSITTALAEAVNARGSKQFAREIRRIQIDIIDHGIETLNRKWKEFESKRLARLGAYTVVTLGLEIGLYFATSPAQIIGLFSAAGFSFFNELEKRIAERGELRSQPMYFIWKIRKG